MGRSRSRRRFLAGVCATGSVVAFAGCGSSDRDDTGAWTTEGTSADETPESTETASRAVGPTETPDTTAASTTTPEPIPVDGHVRPSDEPRTVPEELVCSDERFERREGWIQEEDDLQWGEVTDDEGGPIFALRVDGLSFEHGESVAVTLTNVSHEAQTTGNPFKSNFDVYTTAGWQDPRGWADGRELPVTDDVWEFDPGERFRLTIELTAEGVGEAAFPGNRKNLVTCPELPAGRYRLATTAPEPAPVGVAFDLIASPSETTSQPN